MTAIKTFINKYSVLIYYILTFIISWGGILLVIGGPGGIPGTPEQFERMIPLVGLAMLAGPPVMGILLTALVNGRVGLREFLSRLLKWRVGIRWYVVALLIAPLVMMAIPLTLSLLFPELLPKIFTTDDKVSLLLFGLTMGLMAGFFEELGWTGFAIPSLRLRYGVLTTGLNVGFLWGAWHLLVNFWSSGSPSGTLSLDLFLHSLFFSVGILPAFRVLMVWVYDHTESLLMAMLMHVSLTTSNIIFVPRAITGVTGPAWTLIVAVALWLVVAVVALANGRHFSRQAQVKSPRPIS